MACDLREQDLKTLKIEINPFKFLIEQDYMLTKNAKSYIGEIENFITYAGTIKQDVEQLSTRFGLVYEKAKKKIEEYKLSADTLNPEDKKNALFKLNKKTEVLENAKEIIKFISDIVLKKDEDLANLQEEIKKEEFISLLISIEKHESNLKKKSLDPLSLMWMFSKEEKLENISEAKVRQKEGSMNKIEVDRMRTQ